MIPPRATSSLIHPRFLLDSSIIPPPWFNALDEKYKKILIKLIEPVLQEFMKN